MTQSPWWYRQRAAVFGALYGIGFFAGGLYAALTNTPYQPAAAQLGSWGAPLALALMAGAVAVRVWGSSYLRVSTVWNADSSSDRLLICGPFRYTRNPLYFGNVLMAIAFGLLAPPVGLAVIIITNFAFISALIAWEERGMRARYGAAFDQYCRAVPRLFPRVLPREQAGHVAPVLTDGLRAEVFTGSLLAGMLALVLSPHYGWPIFAAFYIVGIVAQIAVARRCAGA